jgi:TolA-binding protein
MVVRLFDDFSTQNNQKLGVAPRVTWDPDVPMTLTMKWMEGAHKFPSPMLLSRAFLLEHGGYDENFTRRLEDTELQLRLKKHGFELRQMESAVAFQNNVVKIRDLVEREFMEGVAAVSLHAKFPQFTPQVDDMDLLIKNEGQAADASAAVDEIALLEQSGPSELPSGVSDLYVHVCRHYFLHGIFEGLRDIGGTRPRRNSSSTVAIYREASRLEEMEEFDEARRLFRLVLHRPDEQYWDGAEYHIGCIEMALGNPEAAHAHFSECLRLNPAHNKARRALYKPAHYREVEPNVFELIEPAAQSKVLFILFGDLGHVVKAIPVVASLKKRFQSEIAWLTAPEYAALARASSTGDVHETRSRGIIPWDWIYEHRFTHVFFPEPGANHEEWEQSGLHAGAFIARKCAVDLTMRRLEIQATQDSIGQAEEFLKEHGLARGGFFTAAQGDADGRHWPNSNLMKLSQQAALPIVVFRKKEDSEILSTIGCIDKPLEVIALIIAWSCFYIGPAYGVSWMATTTDTPMGVFFDPQDESSRRRDFSETKQIEEWSIYTSLRTVLDHIESAVSRPLHQK